MHKISEIVLAIVREAVLNRAALHTEILALRQQIAVLKWQRPRPSLRMTMTVGGQRIDGKIMEREAAREAYDRAAAAGQRASLLSSERPNIFATSVANIGPGEEVVVEIEYQDRIAYEDSRFTLRFPMVVAPWIRGAPHKGLAKLTWRTKSRTSLGILGRPGWPRDFQRQNALKLRRCQRTTVSGLTMTIESRTPGHNRLSQTRRNRSKIRSRTLRGAERHRTLI